MTILPSKRKHIEILLLTLVFISCFGFILLEFRIFKYLFTVILIYSGLTFKGNAPNQKLIFIYVGFVFISCTYSTIYNHQNIIRVIGNSYTYFGLLFTFIVMKYKPNSIQLEKAIKYLSIIFCCCYLLQWLIYPFNIFSGSLDETKITNEEFRMRMPGSICAYCLFFYGVNKFILYKHKKDLLYAFLGFIPIIIMGFRSLTAATAVFAVLMLIFITRSVVKTFTWLIFGFILLITVSQLNIVQTKINEMLERQESGQTFENDDYIRFLEYEYFEEQFFTKPGERFWGAGVPVDKTTTYYRNMDDAIERLQYYWVDLGLIGLSYIIGIPAVLLFCGIICDCIRKARSVQFQYIRFTLLTVFVGSIVTSMEIFRTGNILIISLYLCLIYVSNKERNLQNQQFKYENRNINLPLRS